MSAPSSFPLSWQADPSTAKDTCDWVSNSFQRNNPDALDIVPVQSDEPWETIALLAARCTPHLILGLFPAFLQIDTRFHRAISALPMPVCTLPEEQLKVAAALVPILDIGAAVVLQQAFQTLRTEIDKHALHPSIQYRVILAPGERPETSSMDKNVLHELHLVPGVVGIFQCPDSIRETPVFHPSERFTWEFKDSRAFVSDRGARRFFNAEIPQTIEMSMDPCPCGRSVSLSLK